MTAGSIAVPTIVPLRAPIPGQHKTAIDSNTKIELHSDTPAVTIYYTYNGSKPEPFQKVGPAAVNTYRYREPFRLSGGKKTVKAVAVSEDRMRESHTVSKTFDVEQLEQDPRTLQEDGLHFMDDMPGQDTAKKQVQKFAHKMMSSKEAWAEVQRMKETEDMMQEMSVHGNNRRPAPTGTKYLNTRMGPRSVTDRGTVGTDLETRTMNGHVPSAAVADTMMRSKRIPPDNATQCMRLQRETDFLKCVYCFAPRPSDPYARFCNNCGQPVPALPQSRMPPPEPGQMSTCVGCNTLVPFNTTSCVVCETPIPQQNIPMASVRLADKKICVSCGTGNPANMTSCLTCEASLPMHARPINFGHSAPPIPREDGRLMTCTKCGRVNNPDARFCDWCGAKPATPTTSLGCSKCQASNNPYARFCASCGVLLEPPQRPDARNSGMAINIGTQSQGDAQWLPVSLPRSPVAKYDAASQTVGLFYPSTKEIDRKRLDEEDKIAQEKLARDRKPLMTAISPGRGYWRKQMDHVSAHLKAYAANDPEFRALIGEPRMGKMLSATVHEDGYELSLTVNFALRGSKDPFMGKKMGVTNELLSNYTTGRKASITSYASQDSLVSGGSTARSRTRKRSARRKKKKVDDRDDKLSSTDKQLLKELGKNGEGDPDRVRELIDEGADPLCVNKDSVPALHVAVLNKHIDAIPVLVQEGADANIKGPNHGNTALHESVSLGSSGLDVIDALLGCNANPQKKNDKGETPYDLAVKGGYDSIANKFTACLGQSALSKLTKPRGTKIDDAF